MENYKRACSAIIQNGKIVMVYVKEKKSEYWTLPGGGVEHSESSEETAIRETLEETNLKIRIIRHLYKNKYKNRIEHCFLAEALNPDCLKSGINPEGIVHGSIEIAEWREIHKMKDDPQVSMVLKKLTIEEKEKNNIKKLIIE